MMRVAKIRRYISRWEEDARRYAEAKMWSAWWASCWEIWAAEFILEDAHRDNYQHPTERLPFTTGGCAPEPNKGAK